MQYEAVLIDFYGTLVEEDGAIIKRFVEAIAEDSPQHPSPHDVAGSWRFAEYCADSFGENFRRQRVLEQESLRELLATFGSQLSVEELSAELFAYWRSPRPYADSYRFLAGLRLPVRVVSNIDDDDIRAAIRHTGFRIEHVVTSESCRSYKPRTEMFHKALHELGVPPERALHIGDSWGSDVAGAAGAGVPVAWLNRHGRTRPDPSTPLAHEVSNLDEVGALLNVDREGLGERGGHSVP